MTALPFGAVKGCSKPNCGLAAPINRHHKKHEALWLHVWAHRAAEHEPQYKEFIKRYHEYREEDIVRICMDHHAEIHMIYDLIIAKDTADTGIPLYLYSWKQARILMQKLENACLIWLQQESPGIDSRIYEANKEMWRGLQKKSARRRNKRGPAAALVVRKKKWQAAKKRRRKRRRR